MAGELGVPRAYGSLDEVLDDPEVDAVYVALPNSMHAEWTVKALRAGKAVLCEKPLAVTPDQAREVEAEADRTGLAVMEGLMYRFHPQNALVRRLLDDGAIGEAQLARVHFSFPLWQQLRPDSIRLADGAGAGALMDVGCYVVSAARFLLGDEPVSAAGVSLVDEAIGVDTDSSAHWCSAATLGVDLLVDPGRALGRLLGGRAGQVAGGAARLIPGAGGMSEGTTVIHVRADGSRSETVVRRRPLPLHGGRVRPGRLGEAPCRTPPPTPGNTTPSTWSADRPAGRVTGRAVSPAPTGGGAGAGARSSLVASSMARS